MRLVGSDFRMNPSYVIARDYAILAHTAARNVRKYTGEPYHVHPIEVVEILYENSGLLNTQMIVGALLHDVLEDTGVTEELLEKVFMPHEIEIVVALTEVFTFQKYPNMRRKERKARERDRLAQYGSEVQTIKLADMVSNAKSIVQHNPTFAKTYVEEFGMLIVSLTNADKEMRLHSLSVHDNLVSQLKVAGV